MMKTKEWLKGSVSTELSKERSNNIKLKGSIREIELLEDIFEEAALNGQCQIISKSGLLDNKGSEDKRKFIAIEYKED